MHSSYYKDDIRAVDAKFEAQKLAFAPIAFHAALSLRDLGILEAVAEAGENGASAPEVARKLGLSDYGVGVLLEMGLSLGLVKLVAGEEALTYVLGKIGYFMISDGMTRANMDFVGQVCYAGAAAMSDSVSRGKPEGLKVFGEWATIYEGLSRLPEKAQKPWFAFDHFYSDIAFPAALPIVFSQRPKRLFDVGGNTAKWALACAEFDPDVHVTIIDLPGQLAMAERNIRAAGAERRVSTFEMNVLDSGKRFPEGADAVWMSQFLDCFSLTEVEAIISGLAASVGPACDIFVLEPFWDKQRFEAASYSLHATSLYFTTMANGNSKMYRCDELVAAVARGGFSLVEATHQLGDNSYSLLRFRKVQ